MQENTNIQNTKTSNTGTPRTTKTELKATPKYGLKATTKQPTSKEKRTANTINTGTATKEITKKSPLGMTCDLRTMRHATIDLGRFWKILSDSNSSNLISNQIEPNRIILSNNEIM